MRRIRLTLEYDGTDFAGWQAQAQGERTVQGALEAALREMTGDPALRVAGAGRTDAGVHAVGQVASFATEARVPPRGFLHGLNTLLPRDLAVTSAEEVALDFDPRRHARGKRYRYRIWNGEVRSPMWERFTWHVREPLDPGAITACAAPLLGQHDFAAFRASDERDNTVRLMRRIEARADGPLLSIDVEADAFLKHMVRVIVGTIAPAGRGELDASGVRAVLESRDRRRGGMTAPAAGLCLMEVFY